MFNKKCISLLPVGVVSVIAKYVNHHSSWCSFFICDNNENGFMNGRRLAGIHCIDVHIVLALCTSPDTLSKLGGEKLPAAIYLVMELGDVDFAHIIKRQSEKGLDFTFIKYYWEQMVRAVHDVHSMNIVYCDIKPANFVLVKGMLKLIDFGISKVIPDDATNIERDSQVGTVNYMSPESLADVAPTNSQGILVKQGLPSDIWSLGCIICLMVYGHTPFKNISMPQKVFYITQPTHAIKFDEDVDGIQIPDKTIMLMKCCL